MNEYPAKLAKIIDGGSPTSVAVPSRLLITARPIKNIVGLIFNFLESARAIGAITRRVATFSTKMEIIPVIARMATIAKPVLLLLRTIVSAILTGTFE